MRISTVYLIQSEKNGYVHIIFSSLISARLWLNRYKDKTDENRHPYRIIERDVYSSFNDILGGVT